MAKFQALQNKLSEKVKESFFKIKENKYLWYLFLASCGILVNLLFSTLFGITKSIEFGISFYKTIRTFGLIPAFLLGGWIGAFYFRRYRITKETLRKTSSFPPQAQGSMPAGLKLLVRSDRTGL